MDVNADRGKYGTVCAVTDVWEANKISMASTMLAYDRQVYGCEGTMCGDIAEDRQHGRL